MYMLVTHTCNTPLHDTSLSLARPLLHANFSSSLSSWMWQTEACWSTAGLPLVHPKQGGLCGPVCEAAPEIQHPY